MVKLSALAALSVVLVLFVRFPIFPSATYLEYEPADSVFLVAGIVFGPLAGVATVLVASFIQAVTVSASGGWVGFVMHVIASSTLVLTASALFRVFSKNSTSNSPSNKKTTLVLFLSLVAGTLAMTLIMLPANLFFTVRFYGVPLEVVQKMLVFPIAAFNLIKAGINSILTFIIIKSAGKYLSGNFHR